MADLPVVLDPVDHAASLRAARLFRAAVEDLHNVTWPSWLAIGQTFMLGRQIAMRRAGTNRPYGRGYQQAYQLWARTYEIDLDAIATSDRTNLIHVMENLPAIEGWRDSLAGNKRLSYSHPSTVWRHWSRLQQPERPKGPEPTMAERVTRLGEMNDALRASGAALFDLGRDPVPEIAQWLAEALEAGDVTAAKVAELARALVGVVREHRKKKRIRKPVGGTVTREG